jgi:hypothetical protein
MSLDSQFSNLADHLQKPDVTTNLVRRMAPLEEELAQKTWELITLRIILADRELFLANLQAELAVFRVRYLREVGSLYAELDDWGEKLAAWLSKNAAEGFTGWDDESWDARICELAGEDPRTPGMPSPWWRARKGPARVNPFLEDDDSAQEFHAPASLKSLYREVAKRVHPDLAADESDRRKRELFMKQANDAYRRGDHDALRRILEDYETSPESVDGGDLTANLLRVNRQITQVTTRLSQIDLEIEKLTGSDIGKLKSRSDAAFAAGEDLLAQMAADLRTRIEIAQRDLRVRSATKYQG